LSLNQTIVTILKGVLSAIKGGLAPMI
jgi:hypothetical protein